jgi:WD40 repeat protein
VTFTPDGQTVLTGGYDRSIRLWKAESGRELHRFAERWQTPVLLAVSPDGKQLSAVGDGALGEDSAIKRWGLTDRQPLRSTSLPVKYRSSVAPFIFTLEGKSLLATASGDCVSFWDVTAGKEIKELDRSLLPDVPKGSGGKPLCTVRSIAVSPDRATLAIGGYNGVDIWDLRADKVIGHWNHKGQNEATAVAFHPDGHTLFVAWSQVGAIHQHELSTGTLVGLLEGHEGAVAIAVGLLGGYEGRVVHHLVVSPDGHTMASGGADGTVRLWELATGSPRAVFEGHRGPVFAIAFSADGKRLISGSADTTALIWDLGRAADASAKPATTATAEVAERAWKQLRDGDAAEGERAIRSLLASPQTTLEMLHKNLKPLQRGDEKQLARWIADLDSKEFKVRDEATAKIEKLGLAADASLHDALRREPSAELRHRIEDLLKPLNRDRIRNVRAVEVLEHAGTPEARDLLKDLARGTPNASLTREAKASLERLEKQ